MSQVRLEKGAGEAIRSFLAGKGGAHALRIEIRSTGCCDASLCLALGAPLESDRTETVEGITFALPPEVIDLAGRITISYLEESGKKGFVLSAERPLNEWDGFSCTDIRTE